MLDAEPVDLDETFAANLKQAREDARLSQEELARRMSLRGFRFHQSTVNKIETGERKVSIGEAAELATVLHVRLEALVESKDTRVFRAHMINRSIREIETKGGVIQGPLASIVADLEFIAAAVAELRVLAIEPDFSEKLDTLEQFAGWSTPRRFLKELKTLQVDGVSEVLADLDPDLSLAASVERLSALMAEDPAGANDKRILAALAPVRESLAAMQQKVQELEEVRAKSAAFMIEQLREQGAEHAKSWVDSNG